MTSSSELDFRSALTVIPIRVLVKISKFTGKSWRDFNKSNACSWPWKKKITVKLLLWDFGVPKKRTTQERFQYTAHVYS